MSRKESKSTQLRKREKRCDALYFHRHYSCPEIVDALFDEDLFDDDASEEYALKWVEQRVKSIREAATPEAILRLQRPAETQRYVENVARMMREALDIIEDDTEITREQMSPRGQVVTITAPRVEMTDRIKAIKEFGALAEKMARVNAVNTKGGESSAPEPPNPAEDYKEPFVFKMSGKPLNALIAERGGKGQVN